MISQSSQITNDEYKCKNINQEESRNAITKDLQKTLQKDLRKTAIDVRDVTKSWDYIDFMNGRQWKDKIRSASSRLKKKGKSKGKRLVRTCAYLIAR
jgi:hypothetical protein